MAGIRVTVLGSGSAGNSMAVTSASGTILLDCGFSARETVRRLESCGIAPSGVVAILVSHEHSDHMRGVRVLAKRLGVPVYASKGTRRAASLDTLCDDVHEIDPGDPVTLGGMAVTAFSTSHDAVDPLGFRFDAYGGPSFGVLTDTGELTPEARAVLTGCSTLGIECNHDVGMVEAGPYPWFLKRRILSARGHLSNGAAADALAALATDALGRVVGLHLSSTNNTAALALEALTGSLDRLGHRASVATATQETPCTL